MDNIQAYVLGADNTTRELRRGSADYWIISVSQGKAEFAAGVNICCAMANQIVIITMSNQNVHIKPSKDFVANMIRVKDPYLSELVRRYLPLMNVPNETMNVITAGKQQKYLPAVIQKMQNADLEDEQMKGNLLEELMIRLYRASPKKRAGVYASRAELVSNISRRLEREYGKDFTLTAIAEEYGISVSYLAHLFKNTTGVPLMRYLLNCRIFAVREYLTQTTIPIMEVAKKCGFNDSSNFGRTFKKETGYSPKQYRQQYSSSEVADTDI